MVAGPHGLAMFLNDSCSDTEHPPGDSDGAADPGGPHNRHFLPIKEELSSQDGFYKGGNAHQNMADLPGESVGCVSFSMAI